MNIAAFTLLSINFAYVGLLPVVFFRRGGRLNPRWWLTAMPFFLQLGFIALGSAGLFPPAGGYASAFLQLVIPVGLCSLSIGLISYTIGTHRIPISLWHQDNDKPEEIVTWGAYSLVRHPFYSAFLIAFLASVFYYPHIFTLLMFSWAILALYFTAKREEKRLLSSEFGAAYRNYMNRTGRFFPKLTGDAA